ncbi:MAG: hypothetical protein ABI357_00875 [Granulicella sp.]
MIKDSASIQAICKGKILFKGAAHHPANFHFHRFFVLDGAALGSEYPVHIPRSGIYQVLGSNGDCAMRRSILSIFIVLPIAFALTLLARQRIWTESGLEAICKAKTRSYFVAKRDTPTDWRPSMFSIPADSGMMRFYGNWHVGAKHYDVMCTARIGEPIVSVGYDIGEPK